MRLIPFFVEFGSFLCCHFFIVLVWRLTELFTAYDFTQLAMVGGSGVASL